MKYKVVYSTKFRKDIKRYKHYTAKMKSLLTIVKHLEVSGHVPIEYRPHKLHGVYEGCMECHVESDFLLIWIDEETDTIELVRLGSHSELFK